MRPVTPRRLHDAGFVVNDVWLEGSILVAGE